MLKKYLKPKIVNVLLISQLLYVALIFFMHDTLFDIASLGIFLVIGIFVGNIATAQKVKEKLINYAGLGFITIFLYNSIVFYSLGIDIPVVWLLFSSLELGVITATIAMLRGVKQ